MDRNHIIRRALAAATPGRSSRAVRAVLLASLTLAALLLSACGSGVRECSPADSRTYAQTIAPVVNRFDRLETTIRNTDMDERAEPLAELQALREQAAGLEIPSCAESSRTYLLGRMDATIAELTPDTPTPAPLVGPTETPAPEVVTATPDAAQSAATPSPTETPIPTATLTPTATLFVGPPQPTDTATATVTSTPDPDITTRVEQVWLCEWLEPGVYQWYEVEITLDQLTPVAEEILSGPYTGAWRSNCPAETPVPTATPSTPTAQPGG